MSEPEKLRQALLGLKAANQIRGFMAIEPARKVTLSSGSLAAARNYEK